MIISDSAIDMFHNASAISTVAAFFVAIIFRHSLISRFMSIFLLMCVSFASELLSFVLIEKGIANFPVLHVYTFFEFAFLTIYFDRLLREFYNTKLIWVNFFVFIPVIIIDYKYNGIFKMDNISLTYESLSIIIYVLLHFYGILKRKINVSFVTLPEFWINMGVLFYLSGNFLFFLFGNYLLEHSPQGHRIIWSTVHSFFNITYNILLSIGIWKTRRA